MKFDWSVMVVYEDPESREAAVRFCDGLIEKFWDRYGFYLSWWSFASLIELSSAEVHLEKALEADLIVVAANPEGDLPAPVQTWFETWIGRRVDREGAIVALNDPGPGTEQARASKFIYLRNVAHRARMDYLTQVPQGSLFEIPESLESFSERAGHVTSVLDKILHTQPPPHLLA
jgi:hypothetical protein